MQHPAFHRAPEEIVSHRLSGVCSDVMTHVIGTPEASGRLPHRARYSSPPTVSFIRPSYVFLVERGDGKPYGLMLIALVQPEALPSQSHGLEASVVLTLVI